MRDVVVRCDGPRVEVVSKTSQGAVLLMGAVALIVLLVVGLPAVRTVAAGGKADWPFRLACFSLCLVGAAFILTAGRNVLPSRYVFDNHRRYLEIVAPNGQATWLPFTMFYGFAVVRAPLLGAGPRDKVKHAYQINLLRVDGGVWVLGADVDQERAQACAHQLRSFVHLDPNANGATLPSATPPEGVRVQSGPGGTFLRWKARVTLLEDTGGVMFLGGFALLFSSAFLNTQLAVAIAGGIVLAVFVVTHFALFRPMALEITPHHVRLTKGGTEQFRVARRDVAGATPIFGVSENSVELYLLTHAQQHALRHRQRTGAHIVNIKSSISDGHAVAVHNMTAVACVELESFIHHAIASIRPV